MSQQPVGNQPRLDVRGAVDLSGLGRTPAPAPGGPPTGGGAATPGYVVDVTEASFADVVQQSVQVPVVFVLWAAWSEVAAEVVKDLVALADEFEGRFLLARVDSEASPQIAQAFQAQSVPSVVAVLKGQPVPLFQGQASTEDVRAVLTQLLEAAAANGVTGRVEAGPVEPETEEPAEPPLPPLHQAAYDAIERDDLDAAAAAYDQALLEDPRDDMARAGRAQVELLRRTQGADLAAVRSAAADAPRDVEAQLAVADLDVLGGKVEDAFVRLVDLVRVTAGEEREAVRVRLVELFGVVGDDDPRVMAARRSLASALY
ncbi:tetratricopeptide repeat protein [Actinotalea sp. BY-33]|uniref:Tetratricopeptide repeat protein n=1 Tax=Actinotalea soli TaxID=2819234 RepID=A0A939LNN6_9CELL|nr:tetratricopeptide repeat protein [Actinotalea soli]MBO1750838.1 tetratricopeptide repeat protein [Actinotalea soli]